MLISYEVSWDRNWLSRYFSLKGIMSCIMMFYPFCVLTITIRRNEVWIAKYLYNSLRRLSYKRFAQTRFIAYEASLKIVRLPFSAGGEQNFFPRRGSNPKHQREIRPKLGDPTERISIHGSDSSPRVSSLIVCHGTHPWLRNVSRWQPADSYRHRLA